MQLHGSGIFQLRVQRLCWGSGILKSNATLRSRQCIQASQFFAATQDVCGKVYLTRALYKQAMKRFLYKHKQVLSLVYGGQHGFPKSGSKRQGDLHRGKGVWEFED